MDHSTIISSKNTSLPPSSRLRRPPMTSFISSTEVDRTVVGHNNSGSVSLPCLVIKAVFFLIGEKVDKNPDIVRRIVEEGHIVANHTYSHSGLFPLSGKGKVMQELQKCGESIKNAIGRYPLLFRPPFGATNPIIGRAVNAQGLKTIGWSIRSLDTVDGKTRAEILRKVEAKLHPGAIILLHDRCAKSDELLESIIESALNRNYSFIPLDKMLKIDVYEN